MTLTKLVNEVTQAIFNREDINMICLKRKYHTFTACYIMTHEMPKQNRCHCDCIFHKSLYCYCYKNCKQYTCSVHILFQSYSSFTWVIRFLSQPQVLGADRSYLRVGQGSRAPPAAVWVQLGDKDNLFCCQVFWNSFL